MNFIERISCIVVLASATLAGKQEHPTPDSVKTEDPSQYVLGPDDQIKSWALGVEEITDKPVRIDPGGYIDLPLLGRMRAAGLTVEQFRTELLKQLAREVREPKVSIDIVDFGSQPVSVMGAVNHPGIHQCRMLKSAESRRFPGIYQYLSLALREYASSRKL